MLKQGFWWSRIAFKRSETEYSQEMNVLTRPRLHVLQPHLRIQGRSVFENLESEF